MIELYFHLEDLSFRNKCRYVIKTLLMISGISMDNDISIFCESNSIGKNGYYIGESISSISESCNCTGQGCNKKSCNINNSYERKYDVVISDYVINEILEVITCSEEYGEKLKDSRGRFLAKYSKRKDLYIPVINYYANGLKEALERAANNKGMNLKIAEREFTVVLTHDVDNITDRNPYVFLHRIRNGLAKIKAGKILEGTRNILFAFKRIFIRDDAYLDFEKFMELEEKYGFKSTFYFMNGRRGRYGARYNLEEVVDIIKKIELSGWESALHTNYFSYNNSLKIKEEKARIEEITGKMVYGCRNHYLRFDVPKTWHKIEETGMRYDTTLGYADCEGFRAGVAFPFYPYDLAKDRMIEVLEIPLTIMDQTLVNVSLKDKEKAWEKIKRILDETRDVKGAIAVNFHTGVFYDRDYPGWKDIYIKVLKYLKEYGGRGITARELYKSLKLEN